MEEQRSPLVRFRPFGAGIFKALGSIDPMPYPSDKCTTRAPGYPSAWLHPCRTCLPPFHLAKLLELRTDR